jgi:hypothetical protein
MPKAPKSPSRQNPGRAWRVKYEDKNFSSDYGDVGELDEVALDGWLHVERMSKRDWFVCVAGKVFNVHIPTRGPIVVVEEGANRYPDVVEWRGVIEAQR